FLRISFLIVAICWIGTIRSMSKRSTSFVPAEADMFPDLTAPRSHAKDLIAICSSPTHVLCLRSSPISGSCLIVGTHLAPAERERTVIRVRELPIDRHQ
ncbi:hypothetical protein HID58_023591, partial [Brassica napus]